MRTALCISGELRRVSVFFPAIKKHILEKYNPDVFISTWNMPDGIITSRSNTIRDKSEVNSIDETNKLYEPTGIYIQKYGMDIKNAINDRNKTQKDNLICMAFHINKSINLARDRSILLNEEYDLIIRYRFDYAIKINFEDYDWTKINIPIAHSYEGYHDQFAFGNPLVMYQYADWFVHIEQIENDHAKIVPLTEDTWKPYVPWHPESALKRYLDNINVPINLIDPVPSRYCGSCDEEVRQLYD